MTETFNNNVPKRPKLLVKLGGSILQNQATIYSLCHQLAFLSQLGIQLFVVHGGGKNINEALAAHQIPSEFIDGLRVTSSKALSIIHAVLMNQINKPLVKILNQHGIQAVGLSGANQHLLQSDFYSKHHGYVGKIVSVKPQVIQTHLTAHHAEHTLIPVIAPLGINHENDVLNINADDAASHLAVALQVDKLIYLTDQDGVLDAAGRPFEKLDLATLACLKKHCIVKGGMLAKTRSIMHALDNQVSDVCVLNGSQPNNLINLVQGQSIGTHCLADLKNKQSIILEKVA